MTAWSPSELEPDLQLPPSVGGAGDLRFPVCCPSSKDILCSNFLIDIINLLVTENTQVHALSWVRSLAGTS